MEGGKDRFFRHRLMHKEWVGETQMHTALAAGRFFTVMV